MIDNPPKTLEEAVKWIVYELNDKDKKTLASCLTDREMIGKTHHGLGTSIRNSFGLWGANEELVADLLKHSGEEKFQCVGDDACAVLLSKLWETLREEHE